MVPFILNTRELHGVTTADALVAMHKNHIGRLRQRGMRYVVHTSPDPVLAFISANKWVAQCACGAGNAVNPEWSMTCCFGCGAVHTTVVVPREWREIERLLMRRAPLQRHWMPGETVADLIGENLAAGLEA